MYSAGHENVYVRSYTICIILAVIALAISIRIGAYFAYSHWYLKKILLVSNLITVLKQLNECNSIELINGKSQTNRDQKSNLLILQHNQYWRIWFKLTKNRQKKRTKILIFTILDASQLKKMVIVKIFTV